MTLPRRTISLLDIQEEFGGEAPHSLSEYLNAGGTDGSDGISLAKFRGKHFLPKYSFMQKLIPSDTSHMQRFGHSTKLSHDGSVLLVGAWADDEIAGDAGAAYIYLREGDYYVEHQKLTASDGAVSDNFSFARVGMDYSGDTIAICSHLDDTAVGENAGSCYVFKRSGDVWSMIQKLEAWDAQLGDYMGFGGAQVSEHGDLIVIGALNEDQQAVNAGAVYIWTRNTEGVYVPFQKLIAADGAVEDRFGYLGTTMSRDKVTIVVGAYQNDQGGENAGALYVFCWDGINWKQTQKILCNTPTAGDFFGHFSGCLSADGQILAVDVFSDDTYAGVNSGAVYVYYRTGNTFVLTQKLLASDLKTGDFFSGAGIHVSDDGNIISVTSHGDDNKKGAVYVFTKYKDGAWIETQKITSDDTGSGDEFGGAAPVMTGDTNTMVIGSRIFTEHGIESGAAYVFTRGTPRIPKYVLKQQLVPSDGEDDDYFGLSCNISNDGSVLVVNSNRDDSSKGAIYLYLKDSSGKWYEQQKITASDGEADDYFGSLNVGMNWDNSILAIGAYKDDTVEGINTGSIYIFKRSGNTWIQSQHIVPTGIEEGDFFGFGGPRLSYDGSLLIATAYSDDDKGDVAGAMYVFEYDGTNYNFLQKITASDGSAGDKFGYVGTSISRDNQWLTVTAPYHDSGAVADTGAVYVFKYNGTTFVEEQKITASDAVSGDAFGFGKATLNGDGTVMVVGSGYNDEEGVDSGAAYIFTRSGDVFTQIQKIIVKDSSDSLRLAILAPEISTDGSIIVLGSGDLNLPGSAYIFARNGNNDEWIQTQKIESPYPFAFNADRFATGDMHITDDTKELVIGAQLHKPNTGIASGAAYVYENQNINPSVPFIPRFEKSQDIYTNDPDSDDRFGLTGTCITRDGMTLVAGAYQDDQAGENAGAGYVFKKQAGIWVQTQKLIAPASAANDILTYGGISISANGLIIAAGARGDDTLGTNTGAIHIWTWNGSTYVYTQKVTSGSPNVGDLLGHGGCALSDEGTHLVATSHMDDTAALNAGSGELHIKNATTGQFEFHQMLIASDAAADDNLGWGGAAISAGAGIIVIGAHMKDGTYTNQGAVYIFQYTTGQGWIQIQKIISPEPSAAGIFGAASVSLAPWGQYLFIPAYGEPDGTFRGNVYVYERQGDKTFKYIQKLVVPYVLESDDYFGFSHGDGPSCNEDCSIVGIGAMGDDDAGSNRGCVYIFRREDGRFIMSQKVFDPDGFDTDYFGRGKVSMFYDGSGFVTDAWASDDKAYNAGKLVAFDLIADENREAPSFQYEQIQILSPDEIVSPGDYFGFGGSAMSAGGNIVVLCSHGDDDGGSLSGAAYVFVKDPESGYFTNTQKLVASTPDVDEVFGKGGVSISRDGSMIAVCVNGDDVGGEYSGAVAIFVKDGDVRGDGQYIELQRITAPVPTANEYFGAKPTLISSNLDKLFITCGGHSHSTLNNAGAVFVYTMQNGLFVYDQKIVPIDPSNNGWFSSKKIVISGDETTLAVCCSSDDDYGYNSGCVYIFKLDNDTWVQDQKLNASDADVEDYFGTFVGMSLDGNTIAVSAIGNNDLGNGSGPIYVFKKEDDVYIEKQILFTSDGVVGDSVGEGAITVSDDGSIIIVGSKGLAGNPDTSVSGWVYVFVEEGNTYVESQKLVSNNANWEDAFGSANISISADGSEIIATSPFNDSLGNNVGTGYVFRLV